MNQPIVSIIIPIYNAEQYLNKCIDSILSQTFSDFECILIDDCSADSSFTICNEYAKKDARIKIISNETNKGISLTRRIGLRASCGQYIQYIDADDWIENTMIEEMYDKATAGKYDILICDYYFHKDGIVKIYKQNFNISGKDDILKNILSIKIKSVLWNKLVKRELYLQAQYPEYNSSEDYVITIQNIFNADTIGFINLPLYHYCYNALSISNNTETKIKAQTEENRNWKTVIALLQEKYGSKIILLEPELSNRINYFKLMYLLDKDLRNIKELFQLYPESGFAKSFLKTAAKALIRFIVK